MARLEALVERGILAADETIRGYEREVRQLRQEVAKLELRLLERSRSPGRKG